MTRRIPAKREVDTDEVAAVPFGFGYVCDNLEKCGQLELINRQEMTHLLQYRILRHGHTD